MNFFPTPHVHVHVLTIHRSPLIFFILFPSLQGYLGFFWIALFSLICFYSYIQVNQGSIGGYSGVGSWDFYRICLNPQTLVMCNTYCQQPVPKACALHRRGLSYGIPTFVPKTFWSYSINVFLPQFLVLPSSPWKIHTNKNLVLSFATTCIPSKDYDDHFGTTVLVFLLVSVMWCNTLFGGFHSGAMHT